MTDAAPASLAEALIVLRACRPGLVRDARELIATADDLSPYELADVAEWVSRAKTVLQELALDGYGPPVDTRPYAERVAAWEAADNAPSR
jgi:hypothetical protein